MMAEQKLRVNVYLSADMKDKAEKKAKSMGISVSGLMSVALNEYIKQDSVTEMAEIFKKMQSQQQL